MIKTNIYLLDLDGLRKKNFKKRLFIALTISLIIFSLFSIFAFAASCNCDAVDGAHTKGETYPCTEGWNFLNETAFKWNKGVNNTTTTKIISLYTIDFSSGTFKTVWGGIKFAYEPIAAIGYLLVILYFIFEIIENTTRDNFNIEHLLKLTIKLLVAVLLITNGLEILKGIAEIGNSMVYSILKGDESGDTPIAKALYEQFKDEKWYNCIGAIIGVLFPYILNLFSTIVIVLMIYSRYIEIGVRALFAPIGMANIFDKGLDSSGMKYLKKYAATCFQGAIMAGIILASDMLTVAVGSAAIPNIVSDIGLPLIIQLCTMMAIIKSKTWANDIMGVA